MNVHRQFASSSHQLVDRYYDPATDQFLSVDPLLAQTGQPYAFTGDDPLNKTDPLGLTASPTFLKFCATNKATQAYCHSLESLEEAVVAKSKSQPNSGGKIKDIGLFVSGLIVIFGADLTAASVFVAGFPEDLIDLPAETGLFGGVLSSANVFGLGLIYKSLGMRPPRPFKYEPGPLGGPKNQIPV